MTKEAQNQIIKDVWTKNLQKETKIPDDIGQTYRKWLIGKVKQASSQLQAQDQSQDNQNPGQGQQASEGQQTGQEPQQEQSQEDQGQEEVNG